MDTDSKQVYFSFDASQNVAYWLCGLGQHHVRLVESSSSCVTIGFVKSSSAEIAVEGENA
jgi:hypothetical protein